MSHHARSAPSITAAHHTQSPTAYADAVTALAAALLSRYFLMPWLGTSMPFATAYVAIAFAAWRAGWQGAVLVVAGAYVACGLMLANADAGRLAFGVLGGFTGLAGYLFTSALIILLAHATRAARARERQGRELLSVLLHGIADAVITTDTALRVTSMNGTAERLTGWTEAAALGRPLDTVLTIVHTERRVPLTNPVAAALNEPAAVNLVQPTTLIGKAGSEYDVELSTLLVRGDRGDVLACVLTFRDISNQRQLSCVLDAQLEGARVLASILESTNDAVIRTSLDGVIESWNPAAENLFGYAPLEVVGRSISQLTPRDRPAEEHTICQRIASGNRVEHFVTERVRSDFQKITVALTVVPIRNAAGHVSGALTIAREVRTQ